VHAVDLLGGHERNSLSLSLSLVMIFFCFWCNFELGFLKKQE
jgi:hypothetical protein